MKAQAIKHRSRLQSLAVTKQFGALSILQKHKKSKEKRGCWSELVQSSKTQSFTSKQKKKKSEMIKLNGIIHSLLILAWLNLELKGFWPLMLWTPQNDPQLILNETVFLITLLSSIIFICISMTSGCIPGSFWRRKPQNFCIQFLSKQQLNEKYAWNTAWRIGSPCSLIDFLTFTYGSSQTNRVLCTWTKSSWADSSFFF